MSYIHYNNTGAIDKFDNLLVQHCQYYKNISEEVWVIENNTLAIEIGRTMKKQPSIGSLIVTHTKKI